MVAALRGANSAEMRLNLVEEEMIGNAILDHRIPARLKELNAFIELSGDLDAAGKVAVTIDDCTYDLSDARFLLHPLADSGALTARALLIFMGISYDAKSAALSGPKWQKDDVKITDLNLSAVSPAQATSGWSIPPADAADLLRLCFVTGNKVSAHLTQQDAVGINASFIRLRDAFKLVTDLVNRDVYRALGHPDVRFASGSQFGSITKR